MAEKSSNLQLNSPILGGESFASGLMLSDVELQSTKDVAWLVFFLLCCLYCLECFGYVSAVSIDIFCYFIQQIRQYLE